MTDEPEKHRPIAGTAGGELSGALTAEQRAELRQHSATARVNAQAAAMRCRELKVIFEASVAQQALWRESLTRVLPELRESVARYARCLKSEGAAPEQMLALVKEALHEALPSSIAGSAIILDMSVSCAIEAYFEQTAA